MFMNSPTDENVSLSLTFLGKKILRSSSVAPALKQRAWETAAALPSDSDVSMETGRRAGRSRNSTAFLEELPGSVPDLREEVRRCPPCPVRNTHLDRDAAPALCEGKGSWLNRSRTKWTAFRQWVKVGRRANAVTGAREDTQPACARPKDWEEDGSNDVKIFIPYDSAKLCIAQPMLLLSWQITEDMQLMKTSHLEMVQELEENFQMASKQNQVPAALQELQITRLELGKVQEMLSPAEPEEQRPLVESSGTAQVDDTAEDLVEAGAEGGTQTPRGAAGKRPLEGAQARLENLKQNLYKREREITQFLQGDADGSGQEGEPTRQGCSALLNAVIHKAHCVYVEVSEARLLLDSMAEENQLELDRARELLEQLQTSAPQHGNAEEGTPKPERGDTDKEHQADLQTSQVMLQKAEIIHTALDCIRRGTRPGLDRAWETGHSTVEPGAEPDQDQLQLQQVREENKRTTENYNSERIMRKKYYNMVEDMKGKIRVFCRIRPMNRTETAGGSKPVVDCVDEYSVVVETPRGLKEFQFDKVFSTASSQEEVFQDTSRLIQSAIDGFNVCIFSYGQTGSGKTFTMVGDKDLRNPGIMPRAFRKIFDLIQENASKFDFKVSAYMLELYNDRLLDLFVSPAEAFGRKIEIKKDKKGLVFAQGAETMAAGSAEQLLALLEQGCANRHIAATKMNMESSRSHLIIGITIESTNLTNGSVSYGKLSLVDLAGSERAAKTGAKDDQLKEANSINKSLSALGDVIFALSSEQSYVPYRNNKLTQVMQDSLGGNAKTLMFVNVSPSDCNAEETLTSLTYATRVKAITNSAHKNLESKEIAHLKEIILKLRSGQPLEEEV
ncbi:hypothetical protein COCON_G00153700 [Conger conger]|uniref:Kinesin-like protein n=1 Tax=Conger conger TaxID=82655 RepID=A0A9Q1HUW2_CONCO|nr:hypothetical protein COCON_G00153700 [Conger conger]